MMLMMKNVSLLKMTSDVLLSSVYPEKHTLNAGVFTKCLCKQLYVICSTVAPRMDDISRSHFARAKKRERQGKSSGIR